MIIHSCNKGSTPSSNTGPSSAKSGNTYLYAEASSPAVQGDSFIFETPSVLGKKRMSFIRTTSEFNYYIEAIQGYEFILLKLDFLSKWNVQSGYSFVAGPKCLTFWYHMYGGSIGSLHVKVNGTELWSRSGDQGDVWLSAEVNVSTTAQNYKV